MTMSNVVTVSTTEDVAVVTIDNPPVNALGLEVRVGLLEAIERAEQDDTVKAIVIHGAGRSFPVGADINEFGQPPRAPWLPEVFDRIELCAKPVIALVHGTALGGGLELALAAHYRLADSGAKLGLPEVSLGILPGAGGTQRAPRLIGAGAALNMMLGGKPIGVAEASRLGLIDGVIRGDRMQAALSFARSKVEEGPRPTRDVTKGFADPVAYQAAIRSARSDIAGMSLPNLARIVDCIEAAALLPFEAGMAMERAAFDDCVVSDDSKALRHVFFAERRAARVPERLNGRPRTVEQVAVVGAGLMGVGITISLLDAGLTVQMLEQDAQSLAGGLRRVDQIYDRAIQRGTLTGALRAERLSRLSGTLQYVDLEAADLVIESVVEDMAVKSEVFSRLDAVMRPGAILASNTSYLDLDQLAAATRRAGDVIGLHFFSPAHIMSLIEIGVGTATHADVVATGFALAKRLGKTAVRSGLTEGFIGNRMLQAYRLAADYTVELGASPYEVDAAMRAYGFAMGPYQVLDMAGLDISWSRRKRQAASRPEGARYVALGDRLCEAGRFGRKTGRGYYIYEAGVVTGQEDPEVLALLDEERALKEIRPRQFTPAVIAKRCLAAMINEGMRLLSEGIALRPSDIDTVMVHAFGFPRHRGGPMMAADLQGLLMLQKDMRLLASEDPDLWTPDPILAEMIKNGQSFASLNETPL